MRIGILSVQGAVEPHQAKFQELGVESIQIRTPEQLAQVSSLVLPGGESSSMIRLLKLNGLWESLIDFIEKKPSWGLCAGAILLAQDVTSPSQDSLKKLDMTIVRNAYGRQNESFIAPLNPSLDWVDQNTFEGIFIRAPRISRVGTQITTLFTHRDGPVMVKQGMTLASTFHPELGEDNKLHRYFLRLCQESL